jgi:hypothetical protein
MFMCSLLSAALAAIIAVGAIAGAQAQPRPDDGGRRDGHGPAPRDWHPPVRHDGPVVVVPPDRRRHYRNVVIVRPHGHWYPGYAYYRSDAEAYRYLAFTAISLASLDALSEAQERALEAAQVRATTAPIGQTITWNDGGVSGAVVALRDGTSTSGRYCREFQQTVTVGGKPEQAYGTACQQPDGAWEIVATR